MVAGVAFIALCSASGFQSQRHELSQDIESQSASKAAGCRKNRAKIVRIKRCEGKTAKGLQKVVSLLNYSPFSMRDSCFLFFSSKRHCDSVSRRRYGKQTSRHSSHLLFFAIRKTDHSSSSPHATLQNCLIRNTF